MRPATRPQVPTYIQQTQQTQQTSNTQTQTLSSNVQQTGSVLAGSFQTISNNNNNVQTTTRPLKAVVQDSSSSAATQEEEHEHHHHGAHIENIDVVCAKDKMTIKLLFSGPFEGVIYSKVNKFKVFFIN